LEIVANASHYSLDTRHSAALTSGNLYTKFKLFNLVGSTACPSKTIFARSVPNINLKIIPGTFNTKL